MERHRLFEYAQQCVQRGHVIELSLAESRGLVRLDAAGRVIHVSDDLIDLGNYTQRGHVRVNGDRVKRYFA